MMFLPKPTVRFTVLSETLSEDDFGDPIDTYDAERQGIPGHLWEQNIAQLNMTSADGRTATVKMIKALITDDITITRGERLKEEVSGDIFVVTAVKIQHSALGVKMPQEIELERVI